MRLSPLFDVIVGSREKDKAEATCKFGIETLRKRGQKCSLTGVSNQNAVDDADIVILAILTSTSWGHWRHSTGLKERL